MLNARDLYEKKAGELSDLLRRVRDLIRDDAIEEAVNALLAFDPWFQENNQLLVWQNTWKQNESNYRISGVLQTGEYNAERRKAVQGLLHFLENFEANAQKPPTDTPAATGRAAKHLFWLYDEEAAKRAEDLRKFFYILEKNGTINSFDIHRDIGTRERDEAIRENLHRADLVICLVTPMFLISCLPLAEEAVERKTPVAPVLLEDTPLHGTVLEKYYSLPTKYKNVAAWVTNGSNVSAAYMDIYTKIKDYLDTPGR